MNPMTPLPPGWEPSIEVKRDLHAKYGKEIDLRLTLDKFRAYHAEGQTSRNWDARFTAWVISDVQRARERTKGGTDDLGVPLVQHESGQRALQPGDPDYVSLDDLAETARQQALSAKPEEQP